MIAHDLMIEARDLRRTFGSNEAVAGISFSTRRGEIFGLLGPNGAGKTTTIRMLTGQIDPSGGSAVVAGCDIVKERAQLKDPIRTFSNGMKQRIMIARALLHRPPMLFLDEPSRGLDPISAREVRQTVKQLSQEGITILLTTHLMEEADQLCQHVAFIVNGRLVADDAPRTLKLSHGQRALSVMLEEDVHAPNGNGPFSETTLSLDNPADQQRLSQWMAQGKIRAVHSREATLEEVFIELAGVRPA
jgi:ABC-2 type transport system ATP-binding protein